MMNDYNIRIVDIKSFFIIENANSDTCPCYFKTTYAYGEDTGEYSSLFIDVDMNTRCITAIDCMRKFDAMESSYLSDSDEDSDLETKKKATFVTPRGVDVIGSEFIKDFTVYYSKDMLEVLITSGEPYYRYTDGRLVIYYDINYDLLSIIINNLTEEEYEALRNKVKQYRSNYI